METCKFCKSKVYTRNSAYIRFLCCTEYYCDGRWFQSGYCKEDCKDAEILSLKEENNKLREAIREAGFGIMQTSGKWSIHDISEKAKVDEEKASELIMKNIELEAKIRELEKTWKPW